MQDAAAKRRSNTLILDVRNHYEHAVGRFPLAVDPGTRTFGEFRSWCEANEATLRSASQVLLYCTGGVRCEKASTLVSSIVAVGRDSVVPVHHLKGGIHRYLEQYPDGGFFCGANFVFDARRTVRPEIAKPSTNDSGLPPASPAGSPPGSRLAPEIGPDAVGRTVDAIVQQTAQAVGVCEECGEGSLATNVLHDGRRCHACRMLVLACDRCADRDGPTSITSSAGGLMCIRCKADRRAAQSIDGLRSSVLALESDMETLKGRKHQSKRQQTKRRLELLRAQIAELE